MKKFRYNLYLCNLNPMNLTVNSGIIPSEFLREF